MTFRTRLLTIGGWWSNRRKKETLQAISARWSPEDKDDHGDYDDEHEDNDDEHGKDHSVLGIYGLGIEFCHNHHSQLGDIKYQNNAI